MRFNRSLIVVITLCLLLTAGSSAQSPEAKPTPVAQRILIVSIDGLRPDLMLRANTPTLRSLLPQSTFTFWARTTPHSITLPSHVSMLTGVVPRKHEIEWNKDLPLSSPVYPKFPSLFEVAKKAGYTTAMAAGKSKFDILAKPGTVDHTFITKNEAAEDTDVAAEAVKIIAQHKPQVMFVHLPTVDNAGHAHGWGSREQLAAITGADTAVSSVLQALESAGVRESTVVLITADHGGAGKTHLADDPRARFIPWILSGPGVRKDLDLTMFPKTMVETEDTFATACYLLGIARSPELDGKPIIEVLEKPVELLTDQTIRAERK